MLRGNCLTPPVSAWRRCHPPLRGGKTMQHPWALQRGIDLLVDAYPLILSVLGRCADGARW
jgi:hypothetical protein